MFIKQYLIYKIIKYMLRIISFMIFTLILLFIIGWGMSSYQPEQANNISAFILELIPDFVFELAEKFYFTVRNFVFELFS